MRTRLVGILCVGSALLATGSIAWSHVPSRASHSETPTASEASLLRDVSVRTNATVVRVIDGDTLLARLDGETEEKRVRLLGINAPETVDPRKTVECFGKEASKHLHARLDGRRVQLAADPQADERDRYDRLLRNVTLEDGTDVNAALVRDGYAYALLSFPLNTFRRRELRQLQEAARIAQRGLWNPTTCNGHR